MAFTHKKVVDIYIVCEIKLWPNIEGAVFALVYSLFGAVKLTKSSNPD